MAKKQLKKLNQPKKYLQGGSNMGSVSMMRQNPYFIGQVNQDAAEEDLANMQEQIMQNKQTAAQAKKDAKDMQNQQLDQTVRDNTANLIKSAATDQKAGRLGNLFSRGPLSGQAAMNISAGTQVAPMYAAPATTTVASNVGALTPGAVEVGANLANTSTNVVSGVNAATAGVPAAVAPTGEFVTQGITAGAKGAAGMSALTSGLIGVAGNIAGTVIKNKTNDNSAYTATKNEATGNVVGSGVKSAATGFVLGNMILPGVGGAIGAGIGAGVGALKARKENKAAKEEADRLQAEQAAVRGAYQSAYVNSRLTGADTGFGLNSSTNMNNQFTNQFQVAKTGGVKKVPGGQIVPIEGTDAVEFKGRSHENGGVTIDKNTEVEGGETMDQVAMNDNNKQDYIFSKYLKLGGKSFAQRHKEILKGNGSQAEIQQLAAMQEKVAGRDSKQIAAYGGFHKYLEGGAKPCPECPPGTVCDPATGNCVSDEDTPSSYDWQATGLEGFKANQAATTTPAKPAGKQVSQADYDFYIREKNARLADEQNKIAAQNGTANAPADATPKVTYPPFGDPVENFRKNRDAQNAENSAKYGTYVDKSLVTANSTKTGKEALEAGMARSAEDDKLRAEKEAQLNATNTTAPVTPTAPVNPEVQPPANTQPAAQTDNTVAPDGTKLPAGYVWDATLNAPVSSAAMTASSNTKGNNAPNATPDWDTQKANIIAEINASPDALIDPAYKGRLIANLNSPDPKVRDQAMYDFNIHSVTQVGQDVDPKASPAVPYSSAPGVVAPFGPTQPGATTGTQTPANTSNIQGGVGATTTTDKLVGSKTSGFLPTFENAKENPLWTKENYPAWKSEVSSAIADTDRQQKIVDYLSNYKGDYSAEVQKRIKGKTGQDLLTTIEKLATDNKPGIFHEAVRQALEATKPPAVVPPVPPVVPPKTTETPTQELPKKFEPCPPGTYRSGDGTCKPVGDVPQAARVSGTLMAGLGQLIPVGAALANPYKIAPGIMGAAAVKGALMPRVNMNQERASAIQQNVAYKNAVVAQNAGPGALAAMQMANTKTNQQMLNIAQQEQNQNRQLAAEEGKMGMQASMFNAENEQKRQMFNTEFNQKERQYRREDILGALDTGASRIAGIVKDDRAFKAQERFATGSDETGSYQRFTTYEDLAKDAKRKNSPYYGKSDSELRRIAAAMYKELNPEGYIGMSEYTKLQEEKAKLQKERDEAEKKNQAKFGGARQYVSRLGELKGVRGTKAKI
jgi:hypothetical protein